MNLTLHVWRQPGPGAPGRMVRYEAHDISPDMSFLEMLDVVNERLMETGESPIAFDHDCREGICGSCSLMINGVAHGPNAGHRHLPAPYAELRRRRRDSRRAVAGAGVSRRARTWWSTGRALDRIIAAGGYISAPTGGAPDGNTILIPKDDVDTAMDAAQCIGCGACVAACPNGSASLFTAAKIAHLGLLPQGQPERLQRARRMVERMDIEGFGGCTLYGECQEACPKLISIDTITRMNRDYLRAAVAPVRAAVAESD